MFISFAILFVFCELGERVNGGFNQINEVFNQFDWHLLPIEVRKNVHVIMAGTQISVTFNTLGSITCVREVFKKVRSLFVSILTTRQIHSILYFVTLYNDFQIVNSAFSYFMILRKFGWGKLEGPKEDRKIISLTTVILSCQKFEFFKNQLVKLFKVKF